jgi:drug/metabolite transporter (DMT)-like permease
MRQLFLDQGVRRAWSLSRTMMTKTRGTTLGAIAIAGWAMYGVLIASNTVAPPFRSMAIVFTFATVVLLALRLWRGNGITDILRVRPATLALGVTGLFGNNCLYVVALALGGAVVPVNIASLSWPVFMMALVADSAWRGRPGSTLRRWR